MKFLYLFFIPFFTLCLFAKEAFELSKHGNPKTGHTLMVFGGIHGNEPGGYFAPAILAQYYTVTKGALWVVPDINQQSITKFSRGINGDMNRKFAKISKLDLDYKIVTTLKKLINNKNIDLIINLHDGHGYYRQKYLNGTFNPKAWGQSYVIDQLLIKDSNVTFRHLANIAQKVSKKLNKGLLEKHHVFGVKNTKTKMQDLAMQKSLTYYAITHNKPALGIETSKNIHKLSKKVFYQLRAIEAFMDLMGIEFKRSFNLTEKGIKKILKNYGTIKINNNIKFDISNLKRTLYYIPMKKSNNKFEFSHPLANMVKKKGYYKLFIGHFKISTFYTQKFEMDNRLKSVEVIIDGKRSKQKFASSFKVKKNFSILVAKGYRVNVIGYTNKRYKNEKGIEISYKQMAKRFAIDKKKYRFRIEIYNGKKFCGMLVVHFKS